jgi:hypothetical protein
VQDLQEIHPMIAAHSIEQIVMMKPMVGPLDDALRPFLLELAGNQVDIHTLQREEDARYFPFARSGFFPFWKKVGQQLAQR